ncbi:MAG: hypothetical protein Q9194_000889 [Teloschistes cf. exilis]
MPYSVTNSFKRGTFKTYTRHTEHAFQVHGTDDGPRKRIRMDEDGTVIEEKFNLPDEDPLLALEDRNQSSSTVPSSPPPADLDDLTDPIMKEDDAESPPSSPPPRLLSPETTSTKPAFSFLKRKRSLRSRQVPDSLDSQPLTNIAPNVQPELPRPAKKARLTQMQIDLGGQVQKTCKTCGMEYIPSNKEDAALHKEFHAMNVGGVDVSKKFQSSKDLKKAYPRDKRWLNEGEDMVMVDRKSPLWAKQKASKIMEVVNTELGSAKINDDDLWAALPPTTERAVQTSRKKKDTAGPENGGDRFKAFLHLEGEKCVGFCLVEKISGGRRVVDPETEEDFKAAEDIGLRSSSISVSADTHVILLGIARIWTSKSHRGRGIAKELLEAARGNFFYGLEVRKDLIAFSQPTESGGVLKSTKTKTVRIVSPHYSRSKDSQSISSITSPPPQNSNYSSPGGYESPTSSQEPSPIDPFSPPSDDAASADDDEDLRRNTIANATATARDAPVILNPPTNPSRKAPALRFGGDAISTESPEDGHMAASQSGSRPRYDVDDFKRLLLTGEKLQTDRAIPPSQHSHIQGLQKGDSSSNTYTSSISRPSIFDPQYVVNQDSPRTSMDNEISDEERHALVQPSISHVGRSRPSVPQSRHGKLVKQHTPQSVSFESLPSSPPGLDLVSASTAKLSFPATPSGGMSLNKPLPPPPRSESPTPLASSYGTNSPLTKSRESKVTMRPPPNQVAVKRSPPAVPTARRHGQGRSRSSTNDSSRSASLSEELSQQTYPSPATSLSTTASRPPPLPPPRKAGAVPAQEVSSPTSSIGPGADFSDPTPAKSRPPPPPSRTASTSSLKRMSQIRINSGSPGAAPPPPPRRRGSSLSQSSLAPSSTFGEDRIISSEPQDSSPGPSSIQHPSRAETSTDEKDLVADLAALQKEVDELRGQFDR